MTEEQAKKIIELLESIDNRLKSVIEGDCTLDVTISECDAVVTVQNDRSWH